MNLISVIVPVYNAEKTLKRCLDSIKNQTFNDFEVILVNDGSKDNSAEICRLYCEKDSRFKLISQENSGPSRARNTGIDAATSKYLAFIDSDDYIEQEMLESLFNAAETAKADLTVCGYYLEQENGSKSHSYCKYTPGVYRGEELKKIIIDALDIGVPGNIPPYSWIRFIKRGLLESPSLRFNTDIYRSEDYLIWNILFSRISSLCLVTDKPLYHYICNPTSITHSYIENYWGMAKTIYSELSALYSGDKKINEHLNIMLMRRACMALTIATCADNKKTFFKDMKNILSDKFLHQAIKAIPFKNGIKKERLRFLLFKIRLFFIIKFLFYLKYKKSINIV